MIRTIRTDTLHAIGCNKQQSTHGKKMNRPALKGGLLAIAAAALFGLSTPMVQQFGAGLGAFTTAALLYIGASMVGALSRQPAQREAALNMTDLPRLALIAGFGAVLGPVALAWGLQHTSGTSASLMLTLEAFFTAVLARTLYKESMDGRVWAAMLLLFGGGTLLIVDRGLADGAEIVGLAAVMVATAAWGVDNTISRALADRDPGQVVLAKSSLGAAATMVVAFVLREPMPAWTSVLALLAIGASGYGLSLRLYLLAQRAFGAARTGSVFAFAPFIGALAAFAMGERGFSVFMFGGATLMLAGVLLHLAESHAHEHTHAFTEHEHAHTHNDQHHSHIHDPMPSGPHNHLHAHPSITHAHAHVPELHHQHLH